MIDNVIAVDWSGNRRESGQRRHIWMAEICGDGTKLSNGLTRDEVCDVLIQRFRESRTVIGLDFAFSFPVSFFEQRGLSSACELWELAASEGETWLERCQPPFWGRPGRRCPADHAANGLRATDRSIAVGAIRPKSPFQIGGAGAVGTGSIRGMPTLKRLHEAGFSIWPFDPPEFPAVVEIYPRALTGPIHKSRATARAGYLQQLRGLPEEMLARARESEDAFDALVSAVRMSRHAEEFLPLRQAQLRVERLEGRIWLPGDFYAKPLR